MKETARQIVFPRKARVELEPFELPSLGDGQLRIRTRFSLISAGTEGIVYNQLYDPGTHWDRWVKFPFYPGYSAVGEVTDVGAGVEGYQPGDCVMTRGPHASIQTLAPKNCVVLPDGVDPREACWFGLAKITAIGARAADYRLGDHVLMIGAGPIGQMALRWAAATGPESLTVVDSMESRLALARDGGASSVICKPIEEAKDELLQRGDALRPNKVIDTTGNAAVFHSALNIVKTRGMVVLQGDTGTPSKQSLTSDVLLRGLTVIGTHDGHETPDWNQQRIGRLFGNFLASGRINMAGMNSHEFTPDRAGEAYEMISSRRNETMGIIFNWSEE
jgi:2-desacetyl-2-hydroxyethyl bacteriochlorophyllide A dehydrogenase